MSGIEACFGYTKNFIKKSELLDGEWYRGRCRNAEWAQWDVKSNCFHHYRLKFNNLFVEAINHPEDDDGFDLFFPVEILLQGGRGQEGVIIKDLRMGHRDFTI